MNALYSQGWTINSDYYSSEGFVFCYDSGNKVEIQVSTYYYDSIGYAMRVYFYILSSGSIASYTSQGGNAATGIVYSYPSAQISAFYSKHGLTNIPALLQFSASSYIVFEYENYSAEIGKTIYILYYGGIYSSSNDANCAFSSFYGSMNSNSSWTVNSSGSNGQDMIIFEPSGVTNLAGTAIAMDASSFNSGMTELGVSMSLQSGQYAFLVGLGTC